MPGAREAEPPPLHETARLDAGADPHEAQRLLVERILSSETFARSDRLITFLRYICRLTREGEEHRINEQLIGTVVFGRPKNYDPAIDSIVRSHASRLRHRLDHYFAGEGAHETLLIRIPKGGYTPRFESRPQLPASPAPTHSEPPPFELAGQQDTASPPEPDPNPKPSSSPKPPQRPPSVRQWPATRIAAALLLLAVTLITTGAVGALWYQRRTAHPRTESAQLFWSRLFNSRQSTVVVNADSGLVILQHLTHRPITLDSYVTGDYLRDLPTTTYPAEQIITLGRARYTSIVDLRIQNRLHRLPGITLDRTEFRYARDLRPTELKTGNAVLLGTYESTPWVQLFEPAMNFYFQNDLRAGIFSIINRRPRPGEQPLYSSITGDPQHTIYGVVVLRPSLTGSGSVLILEGQTMAGTEAAADFVFDDTYLLPFLHSIQRPDGSVPYFELVLRSRNLSGESSRLEMVASRIAND